MSVRRHQCSILATGYSAVTTKVAQVAANATAVFVGSLLVLAACAKANDPADAERLIRSVSGTLPARLVVYALCLLEWSAGLALLAGWRRQAFLAGVAFALIVLTGGYWYAKARGHLGGCGCLGRFGGVSLGAAMARNGVLATACGFAALVRPLATMKGESE